MAEQSTIQQNLIPSEPDLSDLCNLLTTDILMRTNCHAIGTIQSFSAAAQTATVSIVYKRTYWEFDEAVESYQPVLKDYPLLLDVPVMFLGGGGAVLTFPVAAGDSCLLCFNDRDFGNWWQGSTSSPVPTPRLHSTADAIAIVGIRNAVTSLQVVGGVASSGPELRTLDGTVRLGLDGAGKVLIKTTVSGTLGAALSQLVTQLSNLVSAIQVLTVTCTAPGSPSSVPVNAATLIPIASALTTLSATLGGILA